MTTPDGEELKPDDAAPPADNGAPPADGATGTGPTSEVPDAGTVPAPAPEALDAPHTHKDSEAKVASDSAPSATGTPPAEQSAETPPVAAPERTPIEAAAAPPSAAAPEAAPADAAAAPDAGAAGAVAAAPKEAPAAPKAAPAAKAARPAKEAEPKEAPRVAPAAGSVNEKLASAAAVTLAAAYMVPDLSGESVAVEVSRDDLPAVMTAARDQLGMTYLRCLSGIDWQDDGLEVVYHLLSMETKDKLTVKTRVTYADANVPSIAAIFPGADWHERETRDMFGINFEGHPNLVPLLLPEDMTDHFPLRKDNPLQEIEEWQGDNLRDGAGEGDE